jgi:hypothetical protein
MVKNRENPPCLMKLLALALLGQSDVFVTAPST